MIYHDVLRFAHYASRSLGRALAIWPFTTPSLSLPYPVYHYSGILVDSSPDHFGINSISVARKEAEQNDLRRMALLKSLIALLSVLPL
jgi:hypothetical protein